MKGHIDLLVIKSLEEREMTAYGIQKAISEKAGRKISYGALYPALKRLEKAGIIKSGGSPRRHWLTKKGKEKAKEISEAKEKILNEIQSLASSMEFLGVDTRKIEQALSRGFRFHSEMSAIARKLSRVKKDVEKAREILKRASKELGKLK